ncbi:MAG TPA: zinc ribbon domain-containing protein [Acidimicrobiales bacterium]
MKTCECGALNPDDANFCASCGKPLAAVATPSPVATPVESDTALTERSRQRQKRALRIVAIFVVGILVVAGGLTYVLRNVHIEINTNSLVTVRLPLKVCATSVGDASEVPVGLPSTIHVKMPKDDSGTLAFYSDNEGIIGVLAPIGWNCTAAIGADGSSSLHVSPAGQATLASGALSAGSTAETISAQQTSACVGCRVSLACPLFTISSNDSSSELNQPCSLTRPTSETTTSINEHVVEFTDPPGIHGDADPSGGAYPAMGVMTYYGDRASQGSWTETCLLPPTDRPTCKVIIGNFESRYKTF